MSTCVYELLIDMIHTVNLEARRNCDGSFRVEVGGEGERGEGRVAQVGFF